jgi:hypothetical protein
VYEGVAVQWLREDFHWSLDTCYVSRGFLSLRNRTNWPCRLEDCPGSVRVDKHITAASQGGITFPDACGVPPRRTTSRRHFISDDRLRYTVRCMATYLTRYREHAPEAVCIPGGVAVAEAHSSSAGSILRTHAEISFFLMRPGRRGYLRDQVHAWGTLRGLRRVLHICPAPAAFSQIVVAFWCHWISARLRRLQKCKSIHRDTPGRWMQRPRRLFLDFQCPLQ